MAWIRLPQAAGNRRVLLLDAGDDPHRPSTARTSTHSGALRAPAKTRLSSATQSRRYVLLAWLLGWGAAVEVRQPAALRDELAGALAAAAARYAPTMA